MGLSHRKLLFHCYSGSMYIIRKNYSLVLRVACSVNFTQHAIRNTKLFTYGLVA